MKNEGFMELYSKCLSPADKKETCPRDDAFGYEDINEDVLLEDDFFDDGEDFEMELEVEYDLDICLTETQMRVKTLRQQLQDEEAHGLDEEHINDLRRQLLEALKILIGESVMQTYPENLPENGEISIDDFAEMVLICSHLILEANDLQSLLSEPPQKRG